MSGPPRRFIERIANLLLATWALTTFLNHPARGEDPLLVAPTSPRTPQEEQKLFRLPPGFEIELVASEPQIAKPMNIAFDDRSRLWVTQSVEYPFPAKPDATPRDAIKILEDTDDDGHADVVKTFADGLNIPIGVLPLTTPGTRGCVVYSIPHIYRLLDSNGDDREDKREILYSQFGFQDTHGMASSFTWGFDGWIYATHGFANTSEVKGAEGSLVKMHSGNTFRFRPDGSRIEQWTWGQVNPFGLALDPLGNLYSADCHSRPVMMLLCGAYYQSFGKPHDGLGFAPEICTHEHGSTGIAGIVYYAADEFPAQYRDTIFSGNPVTNRINHDALERHGSTLVTVHREDFLRCDDPWFRPVAMTLGPDGAIYVADFYNRIIGHYEVPLTHPGRDRERGRIWRIVYRGAEGRRASAPRRDWSTALLDELIKDLGHPNLAVRTLATNQIADRIGPAAADPLNKVVASDPEPVRRAHAAWAVQRLGGRTHSRDADPLVRSHLLRMTAADGPLPASARPMALSGLQDSDAFVRRAAAEALGTNPAPEHVAPLIAARQATPPDDPQLLHTIRMALRNHLRDGAITRQLLEHDPSQPDSLILADVAVGVASPEAAALILRHIDRFGVGQGDAERYLAHAARYADRSRLIEVHAKARRLAGPDARSQAAMIRSLHESLQARGAELPDDFGQWAEQTASQLIESNQADSVADALVLARTLKLQRLREPLTQLATSASTPGRHRTEAISALVAIDPAGSMPELLRMLADAEEPTALRQHCAAALGQLNRPEALTGLATQLRTAPDNVAVHIAAALSATRTGAEALLAEVAAGKASPRLLQHPIVAGRIRSSGIDKPDEQLAKLTEGLPPAEERLAQLITTRHSGFAKAQPDPMRGAKVFEKNCGICHTLAGRGAKIGPQLDGVGIRGLDRLLEDVLDPNRNVDQAFRSSTLALKNGQVLNGLVLSKEGEVVVIADSEGKETRIANSDIEEQVVSKLSPMPANVAELVAEPDFYDLIAFLLTNRVQPPPAK